MMRRDNCRNPSSVRLALGDVPNHAYPGHNLARLIPDGHEGVFARKRGAILALHLELELAQESFLFDRGFQVPPELFALRFVQVQEGGALADHFLAAVAKHTSGGGIAFLDGGRMGIHDKDRGAKTMDGLLQQLPAGAHGLLGPDPGDGAAGLGGQRLDHVACFRGNLLVDQGTDVQHRDHVPAVLDGDGLQGQQTFAFELLHDNGHRPNLFLGSRLPRAG